MAVYVSRQGLIFLAAVLSGFACGTIYDLLKLLRKYLHLGGAAVVFTDILFWLLSACIGFGTMLRFADGEIRGFQLIGMFLGAAIYFAALSRLFEKLFLAAAKLLFMILKIIAAPILFLIKLIRKLVLQTEKRCGKFGLIVMFYHRKLRKNALLIKKIRKST